MFTFCCNFSLPDQFWLGQRWRCFQIGATCVNVWFFKILMPAWKIIKQKKIKKKEEKENNLKNKKNSFNFFWDLLFSPLFFFSSSSFSFLSIKIPRLSPQLIFHLHHSHRHHLHQSFAPHHHSHHDFSTASVQSKNITISDNSF